MVKEQQEQHRNHQQQQRQKQRLILLHKLPQRKQLCVYNLNVPLCLVTVVLLQFASQWPNTNTDYHHHRWQFPLQTTLAFTAVRKPTSKFRYCSSTSSSSSRYLLKDQEIMTQEKNAQLNNNNNNNNVWNRNASGSFASLLMQLQRKEAEQLVGGKNQSAFLAEDALDLDHERRDHREGNRGNEKNDDLYYGVLEEELLLHQHLQKQQQQQLKNKYTQDDDQDPLSSSAVDQMSWASARELDDAVVQLGETASKSRNNLLKDVRVSPLNDLYRSIEYQYQQQKQQQIQESSKRAATFTEAPTITTTTAPLPPLSHPRHYRDRIGRDMRHLAVSIAASIESVPQWRIFCEENGGLYPLMETILEGVRSITPSTISSTKQTASSATTDASPTSLSSSVLFWEQHRQEESFLAACQACRALRNLCAISPELAAVVTDGLLRANAAWDGALLDGLCVMLEHANEVLVSYSGSSSSSPVAASSSEQLPSLSLTNSDNATSSSTSDFSSSPSTKESVSFLLRRRNRREARLRCKLYVTQLLLAMAMASDDGVGAIRSAPRLKDAILSCSSYTIKEQGRRWLRYPKELAKYFWKRKIKKIDQMKKTNGKDTNNQEGEEASNQLRRPFMEAANVKNDLKGQVQRTANQILAAVGHNVWVPKIPGQKGLRILCLDGGGSRGMVAVTALRSLLQYVGNGAEVADCFDLVAGTSTGGIISFLTALRGETSAEAVDRYNQLIKQIFVKSALSKPRMVFTTASYDESHFMGILSDILKDDSMLDSRSDPSTPLVFCVTSKMSSTPTHVALFRNYNYANGELADHFTLDPMKCREELGLPLSMEHKVIQSGTYQRKEVATGSPGVKLTADGSRHPGSFRVLQRYALRASTAAPTVFKPVMMGGEMYCDGGIVASNPSAVAIHEARTLFPDVPIEMVVSIGTGGFLEQKSSPRIGWDGIIGQIVGSACDGEQIHHILEDILGESSSISKVGRRSGVSQTRYFRFNPILGFPDEFPIDVTEPEKLDKLKHITERYMKEQEQINNMDEIAAVLSGGRKWRLWPFGGKKEKSH